MLRMSPVTLNEFEKWYRGPEGGGSERTAYLYFSALSKATLKEGLASGRAEDVLAYADQLSTAARSQLCSAWNAFARFCSKHPEATRGEVIEPLPDRRQRFESKHPVGLALAVLTEMCRGKTNMVSEATWDQFDHVLNHPEADQRFDSLALRELRSWGYPNSEPKLWDFIVPPAPGQPGSMEPKEIDRILRAQGTPRRLLSKGYYLNSVRVTRKDGSQLNVPTFRVEQMRAAGELAEGAFFDRAPRTAEERLLQRYARGELAKDSQLLKEALKNPALAEKIAKVQPPKPRVDPTVEIEARLEAFSERMYAEYPHMRPPKFKNAQEFLDYEAQRYARGEIKPYVPPAPKVTPPAAPSAPAPEIPAAVADAELGKDESDESEIPEL